MTFPPLNTPIAHDGSPECPVNGATKVAVNGNGYHHKAMLYNWSLVTTYTIIARAPADRIAELEAALALAIGVAESWIHDQLDGTSGLHAALAELAPARDALKGTSQ